MSPAARLVGGRVLPERAGYYLGYRMTEALVAERGLAEALRAPADDFQAAEDLARGSRRHSPAASHLEHREGGMRLGMPPSLRSG